MENRAKRMIVLFSVLFMVLLGIQCYFLKNSYELKKKEIISFIRDQLRNLEDDVDIFDDDLLRDDDATQSYVKLENGLMSESELSAAYQEKSTRIKKRLSTYVDSIFAATGYKVAVRKQIVKIYSHNKQADLIHTPMIIYQTQRAVFLPISLSSGKWETSINTSTIDDASKDKKPVQKRKHSYLVERRSDFDMQNMSWVVFRELIVLMLISIGILVSFVLVFYKTYQTILHQRKQIGVLHDMVDNIAHELKTPIATLKIAAKTLEISPNQETFQVMNRQVQRMENTLHPIMSQDENHPLSSWSALDIEAFVTDFKLVQDVAVTLILGPLPLILSVNKNDMETILANLLGNSVKYGASHIALSIELKDKKLAIHVKDDGIGIEKKDQAYIFEKFYRIQKNNVHDTKGMGLGLYIVKKLVEKHHGTIAVSSTLGQGTLFTIMMPYEE